MVVRGIAFFVLTFSFATLGLAQIAITANDNHWTQANGVQVAANPGAPDSISIIDLSASPPKLVAELEGVPASVIGPPLSVAISPDEGIAIVTASMKIDPANPTRQTEDNRITVVDLKATPPAIIARLEGGKSPAGVSINRQGTMALVANRADGSVSIFTISGKTVAPAGKLQVADAAAVVSHVMFTPDGKRALVMRDADNTISVLTIDGTTVKLAGRDMRTGLRPYAADITRDGSLAVASNVGPGSGDTDTISIIDMRAEPPRVVDLVSVGQQPEGVVLSPDGRWCAVLLQNGSNKAANSPFFADHGKVVMFRVEGQKLTRVAEAKVGVWPQGLIFSRDGRTLATTNMMDRDVQIFQWDGTTLRETGRIKLKGAPAAIRIAEK